MAAPSMTEPTKPPTEVAVGLIFNTHGQVLFAQRPAGKPYAGWWEFPGGKIEAGESVQAALARELQEELGLHIQQVQRWVTRMHTYPHATVRLHFCKITQWHGTPQSLEQQAFTWGQATQPDVQPMLPAALPVLPWLALPDTLQLHAAGITGLQDVTLLPAQALRLTTQRPAARWVGAYLQSAADMTAADALGCDFCLTDAATAQLLAPTPALPLYVQQEAGPVTQAVLWSALP
jgi:8-oxo-dGTP diphosphatase